MANRFHNKFHKYNHHTEKQDNIPDAGYDPIASHESPFLGDFVISPFEDAVLSAKLLNVERISAWGDEGIVIETSGAAMSLDESVISAHSDSISAYFDDTALLRGLSGQLLIEPRFSVLSGLDIAELKTRTGSFELRDTIATLWNNDGLKVNNFAGLYFTQEKGEYRDNDWRIKSFADVNDPNNNGIDFSYFDTDTWVSACEIRKDGVSAMHISSESVNSETIYASEQVSATSGFFVTLSAGSIIGGEEDPKAMRIYHYGSPDIVESPAGWFGFDPVTKTITGFNYQTGRENVVIPWEIGGVAVEAIGENAFWSYYVTYPVETLIEPKTVLSIGYNAFAGCTSLTSVSLPVATFIGDTAFIECSSLTSVSLPAATSIGYNAFSRCSSLTSVSLPVATFIGEAAFYNCISLTSISLPAATSIGYNAFTRCSLLTSVYFGTSKPPEGFNVFENIPAGQVTIYVIESPAWSGVTTWHGMPVVQVEDFGLIDTEIFAKSVKIQDSLIIKDTADGNYYRIQITNGILNTELVSGV